MNKELFLNYCKMFNKELTDLQSVIDEDLDLFGDKIGTLVDLGLNWSFELANIGFELGYANWCFTTKATSFNEIKNDFCTMIMENEKIEKVYTEKELEKIIKRIENC